MRVLTDVQILRPVGGIEICTLEDTAAFVAAGDSVDVLFGVEGSERFRFEAAGVRLHGPTPFKLTSAQPARDLRSFVPALRLARRLRPDVVWLNRAEHVVWGTLLARAAGVRLVAHLHHNPSSPRTRLLTRGVDRFVAVSAFTKSRWVAAGVPEDRVDVLHNALPPGAYPVGGSAEMAAARAALGLPQDGRVITFYGRFSEEKGLPTVLEAFARLGRDDVTLLLAGFFPPDHPTDDVRRAVEALDPGRVRIVPPSADVVPFLHAADVVVAPSWVEEAFGRAVVEAMSTGRPAIGSDLGAVPELLAGGMERFLVPPRDAGALAAALGAVIDWRDTEPGLGSACAAWVEDRFSYARRLERLRTILAAHAR